ncbi:hypothetical protein TD95_001930 [Thielaviopsis punctulata]|uniref:EamA domain-containing protein n=1 Tax=Thielaviopsis punctulata TaxID=72032 RepID=A0A0F4ZFQ8_9PEZI|nr:hypothetical protein TD95_001930 [Thielaviopsis punctulata]
MPTAASTSEHPAAPLLHKSSRDSDDAPLRSNSTRNDGRFRPTIGHRHSSMRNRSPELSSSVRRESVRTRYIYAAFFLVLSLVSFTIQTELSAYIQGDLGWDKAYCMMYFTHSSWTILWPVQLLIIRLRKPDVPWPVVWRRHEQLLRTTLSMVELQDLDITKGHRRLQGWRYLLRTIAILTVALTIAGLSWYVAVNMTTPSDLTAIYNCSAFFAYAFSVPLLKEKLRLDKSLAVLIAIGGVLIVAYGGGANSSSSGGFSNRFLGNILIGGGSVLYGLYEVLYKRLACPPEGVSPGRGVIFANTMGSCIGLFTMLVLWVPLPILHLTGLETFVFPTGYTGLCVLASVISNAIFSGSFLVLISLTSPVLSSVAALLTIFIVAVVDWIITGTPLGTSSIMGGILIIVAFGMLSWSTWREMQEHERLKDQDIDDTEDEISESDEEV